jgi:hypothetical protein
MKTMETTEDVSSYGVEKRVERHKSQRSAIVVREKPMADWKKDLQIFEAGRKSRKRPTLVVGRKPNGKCQFNVYSRPCLLESYFLTRAMPPPSFSHCASCGVRNLVVERQKKFDGTGRVDAMLVNETESSEWSRGVRPYGECRIISNHLLDLWKR